MPANEFAADMEKCVETVMVNKMLNSRTTRGLKAAKAERPALKGWAKSAKPFQG